MVNQTPYDGQLNANAPVERKIATPINESSNYDNKEYNSVMSLFEKAKVARAKHDCNWQKWRDFYDGKQWGDSKRPSYKSSPNLNIVRSTVETVLPIMTDTSPGFDIVPQEPNDFAFADILSKTQQSWWSRHGMDHKIVEVIKEALITDVGILKVVWDDSYNMGLGDCVVTLVDINNIYVDPNAEDFDRKCNYVIERQYKSVNELKRLFPDMADKIQSSGGTGDTSKSGNVNTTEITLVSPVDKKGSYNNAPSSSDNNNGDIEVFECWIKDDTLEDEQKEDGTVIKKYKYPRGKLVTIIPGQKLVLQSVENPYMDGKWPYTRVVDNINSRSFYGTGEVEPLSEIQKLINKTSSVIFDYLNTMTNPVWIIDTQSGVDPDLLTNQVGLIISKQQGTEVRRESPPPLPPQVFELYSLLQSLADQQSGINDVTQGRKPTGITAAEALQTMQEAAQTRVRLKERNLQTSLAKLGSLVISRFLQYYTEPRMVRLVGEDYKGKYPKYIEWYINTDDTGNNSYISRSHIVTDTQNGPVISVSDWSTVPISSVSSDNFDILVVGGTSLPFLKQKRGDLALKLFNSQVIDREELLKALDWPRREEITRRMEQAAQQQAQQAPGVLPVA